MFFIALLPAGLSAFVFEKPADYAKRQIQLSLKNLECHSKNTLHRKDDRRPTDCAAVLSQPPEGRYEPMFGRTVCGFL
jgi:hypothetical protein